MKRVSKKKKKNRGFTLIELVFVIAIIVVLASIFLPLAFNKLQRADEASADASLQEIAAALTSFYDDLRHFPTCDHLTNCNPFPGADNNIVFLAFGEGFLDLSPVYPDAATGVDNWDLNAVANEEAAALRNNGANHLVQNDPIGNGTPNEATDYATTGSRRWRGPYLSRVGVDPWGRAFIAYVGAMESGGQLVADGAPPTHRGWILSAGPNNSLNTTPTSSTLQLDDRGFIFQSQ
jgi:prepilin-type N-terminal cleavage/methylation domain-containing protein